MSSYTGMENIQLLRIPACSKIKILGHYIPDKSKIH